MKDKISELEEQIWKLKDASVSSPNVVQESTSQSAFLAHHMRKPSQTEEPARVLDVTNMVRTQGEVIYSC